MEELSDAVIDEELASFDKNEYDDPVDQILMKSIVSKIKRFRERNGKDFNSTESEFLNVMRNYSLDVLSEDRALGSYAYYEGHPKPIEADNAIYKKGMKRCLNEFSLHIFNGLILSPVALETISNYYIATAGMIGYFAGTLMYTAKKMEFNRLSKGKDKTINLQEVLDSFRRRKEDIGIVLTTYY